MLQFNHPPPYGQAWDRNVSNDVSCIACFCQRIRVPCKNFLKLLTFESLSASIFVLHIAMQSLAFAFKRHRTATCVNFCVAYCDAVLSVCFQKTQNRHVFFRLYRQNVNATSNSAPSLFGRPFWHHLRNVTGDATAERSELSDPPLTALVSPPSLNH